MPFTTLLYFYLVFFSYITIQTITQLLHLNYQSPAWIQAQFVWINPLVVILIFPNLLKDVLPAFYNFQYALLWRC